MCNCLFIIIFFICSSIFWLHIVCVFFVFYSNPYHSKFMSRLLQPIYRWKTLFFWLSFLCVIFLFVFSCTFSIDPWFRSALQMELVQNSANQGPICCPKHTHSREEVIVKFLVCDVGCCCSSFILSFFYWLWSLFSVGFQPKFLQIFRR